MIFPSYDVQDRTDHRRLSHLAAHRDSGRSVLRRSEAGRASVGLAVLGGMVITLVAWMHHHVDNIAAKVVAALATAFLLVGGGLEHAVVMSLLTPAESCASPQPLLWSPLADWPQRESGSGAHCVSI